MTLYQDYFSLMACERGVTCQITNVLDGGLLSGLWPVSIENPTTQWRVIAYRRSVFGMAKNTKGEIPNYGKQKHEFSDRMALAIAQVKADGVRP